TVVIPVTLMGAFLAIYVCGLSINVFTMFGLVLAIGILVDDAIVVVESVHRVMEEEGLPPREATRKAMSQIGGAIVGVTAVLTAVFVPMAFFPGGVGGIYRAKLRVIPVDDSGQVLLDEYRRLLNDRTKIVSVTQVSNALGTVVPVKEIVELAHRAGAKALVDGAQSVSHMRVDVQALDADFFVFSGHKVFGPTGIGVVYGKRALLEDMPPWQGGGNMIADVTFERTVFQPPPNRFEAGTGNIADAVGLGAAIDYVQRVGIENIARYEHDLLAYATSVLQPVPGVRLIGTARDKASVLSFVLKGYETEEVGQALNEEGIA
ncbi:aminotransferase class V-fold PLP-dependent enzyme, partial [Paraburkholderia fungorum]|uniref:aminotransferase class V-fold PLP-dependent enzyme n=1 Tax=Paraburkholderia fungorum TaxID=134537 RepID=UPI0020D16602